MVLPWGTIAVLAFARGLTILNFPISGKCRGKQNDFFDLINDATGDIVDVTSSAVKALNASQFYTKQSNLATRVVDPAVNNRILQIYV